MQFLLAGPICNFGVGSRPVLLERLEFELLHEMAHPLTKSKNRLFEWSVKICMFCDRNRFLFRSKVRLMSQNLMGLPPLTDSSL